MVTYFDASKTVDFLIHGLEEYTAITIMSEKNDEIRLAIVRDLRWRLFPQSLMPRLHREEPKSERYPRRF